LSYSTFIEGKKIANINSGFYPDESKYSDLMKPHQSACITWACRRGRSALFLDTGLGKTLCQLTWADQVARHTDGYILILAPLAVSYQTKREADKFGIDAEVVTSDEDISAPGIYITNYEKLDHFDTDIFVGIVLDESSILKGMQGKVRRQITESFANTQYKLSCTATPSPNDFMELGTQSEFIGVMSQVEMLAMFFIHDGSDTAKWRLKGHGKSKFWEWLSTWAIFLRSPIDLGFDSSEYDLPPIEYHEHVIETEPTRSLFVEPAQSLLERNQARKSSVQARCEKAAEIANNLDNALIWCNLNDESQLLKSMIVGAVEVKGSDHENHKAESLIGFATGDVSKLVSKPKIAGFGMNFQVSNHCIFVGLSDSWESFYQAIRRQWRFGQTKTVNVYIVSADTEGAVVANIKRKDEQHKDLMSSMMVHMEELTKKSVFGAEIEKTDYNPSVEMMRPLWVAGNE